MGPMSLHRDGDVAGRTGQSAAPSLPRDVGGSFGTKQSLLSAIVLMCLAARKAGAP